MRSALVLLSLAVSSAVSAAPAPAASNGPRKIVEDNPTYHLEYSYPATAAAITGLRDFLDRDLAANRGWLVADAKEARAEAEASGYPYHPYERTIDWAVVTDLPGWLSLSATALIYTGGAHPNHGFDALLWDKRANVKRSAVDLFVSKQALSTAIRQQFCAVLDKQRGERRSAPVDRNSGDEFDKCIDPVEQVVILGSSDRRHFNRIGILVEPYAAGPYVEGTYEVTVPVTPAVLAAVKPAYRQDFALKR